VSDNEINQLLVNYVTTTDTRPEQTCKRRTYTTSSPLVCGEAMTRLVVCVPLVGLIVLWSHDTDLGILGAHAVRSLGLTTAVALDPFHSLGMKP